MLKFLQKNVDITNLSNFKTKAKAKYFFDLNCEDYVKKIPEIYNFSKENNLKILFVGGGTNMLFAFDVFDGIIIKNNLNSWNYDKETQILEAFSNEKISEIAEILEKDFGQNLWHRFIGLPGTVGGAVFGNAGCFGLETSSNLVEVLALNLKTGQIENLLGMDCEYSYRNSIFKKTGDYFIIKAKFDLSEKKEKYSSDVDNIYFREHMQPKGNTCGSFFKNPEISPEKKLDILKKCCIQCEDNVKISAGFLIEKVGLKGFHLNTAYFSDLHSNFLMSKGNGNYKDLLDLIKLAQDKVKTEFGIDLEPEVRIIYN